MRKADKKVVIHAGEYCFDQAGTHIHTLLGSCISITLWHPQKYIGGMCHYALPRNPSPTSNPNPRYGDDCMALFERSCGRFGCRLSEFEAKIFGGSDLMTRYPSKLSSSERQPIGDRNSVAAFEMLMNAGVKIVTAHVGEQGYRRIIFDIGNGDVWVKFKTLDKYIGDTRSLSGRK